jgi:hypothetical protein
VKETGGLYNSISKESNILDLNPTVHIRKSALGRFSCHVIWTVPAIFGALFRNIRSKRHHSRLAQGLGRLCTNIIQQGDTFNCTEILRQIVNAPWYVTICTLYHDLRIPTVQDVIKLKATRHISNIADHPNPLLSQLLEPVNRRLKRQ